VGGREGYSSLLNTDTRRELEHFARFLEMARDYGRSIGFRHVSDRAQTHGAYVPSIDHDAQTVIGFLRQHGLAGDFKLNVEANHATLAGHSFFHELRMSSDAGLLGSVDANAGNPQNGWDTDQFPMNLYDCAQAMVVILQQGGLGGGLNFDALGANPPTWKICSGILAAWIRLPGIGYRRSDPGDPRFTLCGRALQHFDTAPGASRRGQAVTRRVARFCCAEPEPAGQRQTGITGKLLQ
jgi:hypothetical protein